MEIYEEFYGNSLEPFAIDKDTYTQLVASLPSEQILNQLLIKKHDVYNTAALTELPIGESKADFIMINGRGIVYEIKTDLDNLVRLENQIHASNK